MDRLGEDQIIKNKFSGARKTYTTDALEFLKKNSNSMTYTAKNVMSLVK